MFDWATSRNRGRTGLPPRLGENMDGYRAGQREVSDPGSVGAGAVAMILIGCGLLYVAFVLISGPLLDIAVAGIVALSVSTIAFRMWPKLGVDLPFKRLFWLMARAYGTGFAAILALLGVGSVLYHAADISILPYVLQVFSDLEGNRLDSPYFSMRASGLLPYVLIYLFGWSVATWVVWRTIFKSEEISSPALLRVSTVMGVTFVVALHIVRPFIS